MPPSSGSSTDDDGLELTFGGLPPCTCDRPTTKPNQAGDRPCERCDVNREQMGRPFRVHHRDGFGYWKVRTYSTREKADAAAERMAGWVEERRG